MHSLRDGHVCGLANSGTELVVAGGWKRVNTTEIYSLDRDEWRFGQSLTDGWYGAGSVQLDTDTLLSVGGVATGKMTDRILAYDAETEGWVDRKERLGEPKAYFAAIMVDRSYLRCD